MVKLLLLAHNQHREILDARLKSSEFLPDAAQSLEAISHLCDVRVLVERLETSQARVRFCPQRRDQDLQLADEGLCTEGGHCQSARKCPR